SVAGYGMSFEDYRLKIKSEVERNKVLSSMVRSKVQIQEAEVVALYEKNFGDQPSGGEEVHLRHIMVTFDPESPMARDSACRTVEATRAQILSGQLSFQQAARETSDANPESGGELGWIHLQELASWMAPELLSMNSANPISQVIDMPFGCNLLELVERRTFQPLSLEQARPQLEQRLYRIKTEEEYARWVNSLRERTFRCPARRPSARPGTGEHRDPWRARAQPAGDRHRYPAQCARGHHGTLGLGQIVSRIRHPLRRGPAPLRRVALRLRAPVSRPDGQTGRRLGRWAVARDLDRTARRQQEPAFDRRHHHGDRRLSPAALRAGRRTPLPRVRKPDRGPDSQRNGRAHHRPRAGHPGAIARPGDPGPQGRVQEGARRVPPQGLRARSDRRRDARSLRRDQARAHESARHRHRGRPRDRQGEHRAQARRVDRGRAQTRRRHAEAADRSRGRTRGRRVAAVPEPRLRGMSPNGACPACSGLGVVEVFSPERIIPDPSRSLSRGAIEPWSRGKAADYYAELLGALAEHYQIDLERPWSKLPARARVGILEGTGKPEIPIPGGLAHPGRRRRRKPVVRPWLGVVDELERRCAADERAARTLARYRVSGPCKICDGTRLGVEARNTKLAGISLPELCELPISTLAEVLPELSLRPIQRTVCDRILHEIEERLRFLVDVGLDYLSLNRPSATLSGGEAQRIRLATQIGSQLMGVLYILDEPSIGLHARDNARLIESLLRLRDMKNSVIVVEHDEATIRAADWVIDMGPGAGIHGGEVVAQGTPETLMEHPDSLTGAYLSGKRRIELPRRRRSANGKALVIQGCREHNLKNLRLRLPLGVMTVVTGVSGRASRR
ncbi:MAG: peptidylprolyl isomerase, partial [Deltaproteobacteria bacterium]|nr:peptidylprolyl isomerase [Deltaproteobacteria bacterium]